jgi:hypothetical protein
VRASPAALPSRSVTSTVTLSPPPSGESSTMKPRTASRPPAASCAAPGYPEGQSRRRVRSASSSAPRSAPGQSTFAGDRLGGFTMPSLEPIDGRPEGPGPPGGGGRGGGVLRPAGKDHSTCTTPAEHDLAKGSASKTVSAVLAWSGPRRRCGRWPRGRQRHGSQQACAVWGGLGSWTLPRRLAARTAARGRLRAPTVQGERCF